MWHWNTAFSAHSSCGNDMRQTHQGTMCVEYNQHWCIKPRYDTEASQPATDIRSAGTHHHPPQDQATDMTWICEPDDDEDCCPVLGLSRTGRWIRCAGPANVGIRYSTCLTMVPQSQSWQWQGSQLIDFPAIAECKSSGGNGTNDYHSGIECLRSQRW